MAMDTDAMPRDAGAYRDAHPSRPVLLVEVAESSYRIDHGFKASLYARARVAEYWIVDVARETVEVHREPRESAGAVHGWTYARVETLRPPATVRPLVAPDTPIPVADLLP